MIYTVKEIIHKIIDWLGLEETFKIPYLQPPCHEQGTFHRSDQVAQPHLLAHEPSEMGSPYWSNHQSGTKTEEGRRSVGWLLEGAGGPEQWLKRPWDLWLATSKAIMWTEDQRDRFACMCVPVCGAGDWGTQEDAPGKTGCPRPATGGSYNTWSVV